MPQYQENYLEARRLGCRTVLTGELAEFVVDLRSWVLQHLVRKGRFSAVHRVHSAQRAKGASRAAMTRIILSAFAPAFVTRYRFARRQSIIPDWVDLERAIRGPRRSILSAGRRWSRIQVDVFNRPGISAEAEDICQELCGIRARRPWVDVDLWEFFLSLPAEAKFPDLAAKTLVRRLLRGRVPQEILDRRDKTVFDEDIVTRVDYPVLQRWLIDPPYRFPGVDYEALRKLIESHQLRVVDFMWAKDLASSHAFLSLFE
jgi:hypothetical protein